MPGFFQFSNYVKKWCLIWCILEKEEKLFLAKRSELTSFSSRIFQTGEEGCNDLMTVWCSPSTALMYVLIYSWHSRSPIYFNLNLFSRTSLIFRFPEKVNLTLLRSLWRISNVNPARNNKNNIILQPGTNFYKQTRKWWTFFSFPLQNCQESSQPPLLDSFIQIN